MKIVEIQKDWYKITGNNVNGYIKIENTTYLNPNTKYTENDEKTNQNSSTATKSSNVQKLSFDMQLNKPSGLSLEQFKKVLTDSKDKNGILRIMHNIFIILKNSII